jgi:transcription antitermination factor NusG
VTTFPANVGLGRIGIAMPLLKREPDIYPATVFDVRGDDAPWWVAHVRSRQEKSLGRYLRPLGIAYYLPQREHRVRRANRTFVSYLPLFSGYLFFRGSASDRLIALRSNLIVKVLDVPNQDLLARELLQLHVLQRSGASLVPCEPLAPGDAVRVIEGPFKGYTGLVVRGADRPRLVVSISILRKAVAVELDRGAVALLPPAIWPRRGVRSAVA